MPIPRIAYALLLATLLALPVHAAAPPVPKDQEETKPTPAAPPILAVVVLGINNPWRYIELPTEPDPGPQVQVTPQEIDPIIPSGPTEPNVIPQETPEPTTLALALIAGGAGFAAWRRKRPKKDVPTAE